MKLPGNFMKLLGNFMRIYYAGFVSFLHPNQSLKKHVGGSQKTCLEQVLRGLPKKTGKKQVIKIITRHTLHLHRHFCSGGGGLFFTICNFMKLLGNFMKLLGNFMKLQDWDL